MDNKSSTKNTHNYLKRSTLNIVSKITPNKLTPNSLKITKHVNSNIKNITNQYILITNITNHTNENLTKKTFAEITANLIFFKKKPSYHL